MKRILQFFASVLGAEYTFYGVWDTGSDLGVVAEYGVDDRKRQSPDPFNNEAVLGIRYTMNDAQSAEFLVLGMFDLYDGSKLLRIEGSRRIAERWTVKLEGAWHLNTSRANALFSLRKDHYIRLNFTRYFDISGRSRA